MHLVFKPDDLVKTCPKLESGLRLGQEGILACQIGPFSSPLYWSAEEVAGITVTREMIADKRKWIFEQLNDEYSETSCKSCHMVILKRFHEVNFDRLGHIDLAATSTCNLRCNFCDYTVKNSFAKAKYDALKILRLFGPEDVVWDAAVDFNGGEPTLLEDFDEYIDYFHTRRIRVFLYTNAVIYRQSVSDSMINGTIRWVCASLDAGSPSTYNKIKKSNQFNNVLENLTRYAEAGGKDGGQLAVKYIFSEDNCEDDDITGFCYAMLALRPQEVWLTFDFEPIHYLPGDCEDFGGYDYSKHISAYAKTYVMLEKHGIKPVHFPEKHLAVCSLPGKMFLQAAKREIKLLCQHNRHPAGTLLLNNFRRDEPHSGHYEVACFSVSPLLIHYPDAEWQNWSLAGKRIALAPAGPLSRKLIENQELHEADIVACFDRDITLHSKFIGDIPILPYAAIPDVSFDFILVVAPEHYRNDIVQVVSRHLGEHSRIIIFNDSYCEASR